MACLDLRLTLHPLDQLHGPLFVTPFALTWSTHNLPRCSPADLSLIDLIIEARLADLASTRADDPEVPMRVRELISFSYETLTRIPHGRVVHTMIWQEQLGPNNPEKAPEIEDD